MPKYWPIGMIQGSVTFKRCIQGLQQLMELIYYIRLVSVKKKY